MAIDQHQPRTQIPSQFDRQTQLQTQSQTRCQSQTLGPTVSQGQSPLQGSLARAGQGRLSGRFLLGGGFLVRGRGLLLAAGLLLASQAPAQAGSVTAESIWDRTNAIQRATSQIPQGATVTGSSCQEVDLRGGSTRYICTVTYSSAPPAAAPQPAATP